jgi:hypothetical protein
MDMIEIKLNEIVVAIGAPMKPRRIGPGPHTMQLEDWSQIQIRRASTTYLEASSEGR